MPIFSTPYALQWSFAEGASAPSDRRYWAYYGPQGRGQTVIRTGGVYRTVSSPSQSDIDAADDIRDANGELVKAVFLGGHVHTVTDAVAAELVAAGYSVS